MAAEGDYSEGEQPARDEGTGDRRGDGASAAGEMAPLVSVMSGQSLPVPGPEIGHTAPSERPDYLADCLILHRGHTHSDLSTDSASYHSQHRCLAAACSSSVGVDRA